MAALAGLFKGLHEVLTTPVTLTGRPLSAEEIRRNRAAKARKRLKATLVGSELPRSETTFNLQGRIDEGCDTHFAISGHDFVVDSGTWMLGKISAGVTATVKGHIDSDGRKIARSVVVTRAA